MDNKKQTKASDKAKAAKTVKDARTGEISPGVSSRDAALSVVRAVLEEGMELKDAFSRYPSDDPAFTMQLSKGTLERLLTLDAVLSKVSSVKPGKMKPFIRNLLRLSVWQILFLSKTPDSAAVDCAVKLAKKHGFEGLSGFVNGVLRNVSRQRDELLSVIKESDETECAFSLPGIIFESLEKDYGKESAEAISAAFFSERRQSFRTITSRISPDELSERLAAKGFELEKGDIPEAFTVLSSPDRVLLSETDEFKDGLFYIMDPSSMAVGETFGVMLALSAKKDGLLVVDLCAAPGGKSIHAADILRDRGRVIARDVSEKKVALIKDNIKRTGLSNITAGVSDATVFDPELEGKADFVIADIPCSGFGVIGRRPGIRYRHDEKSLSDILELQHSILENAVRYVAKGGYIILSTCTLRRAENEENAAFLEKALPSLKKLSERTIFPIAGKCDGFYIAAFGRH